MDWQLISNFFIAMIAIVNPLGKIPLWMEASSGEDNSVRWRLALLVTITALAILLVAVLVGRPFLDLFGIDLASFRVGGGIVIMIVGLDMIRGSAIKLEEGEDESDNAPKLEQAKSRFRRVVVPISMPILAGPGSISTAIVHSVQAEGMVDLLALSVVLLIVMVLVFVTLLISPAVQRLLGKTTLEIQTRFFGLILVGIAVQFMVEGLGDIFPAWMTGSSVISD